MNRLPHLDYRGSFSSYQPPKLSLRAGKSSIRCLDRTQHKQSHICNRAIWLFVFLTAFTVCLVNLGYIMKDYYSGKITLEIDVTSGTRIPFPAVTVCNINPYLQSRLHYLQGVSEVLEGYKDAYDELILRLEDGASANNQRRKRAGQCATFTINFGSVQYSKTSNLVSGTTATINCDKYRYLRGQSLLTCLAGGTWDFALPQCLDCPSGWTHYNDACYKYMGGIANQTRSKQYCPTQYPGAELSLFRNSADWYDFVDFTYSYKANELGYYKRMWIAGDDRMVNNQFMVTDSWNGETCALRYTNWLPSQPNDDGNCVSKYPGYSRMNDHDCAVQLPLVCQLRHFEYCYYCIVKNCKPDEKCKNYDHSAVCLNIAKIQAIKDELLNSQFSNDHYIDSEQPDYDARSIAMAAAARQMMVLAASDDSLANRIKAGYKLPEILDECMYDFGGSCYSLFTQKSSSFMHGNCYTFNNDSSFTNVFTERPGINHGLILHFALQANEYLDTTLSYGFKIIFHSPNMPVYTSIDGFNMAPRHVNRFTLFYAKHNRLNHCKKLNNGMEPGHLHKYRVEECERKAFQQKFIELCGCLNPEYPVVDNWRVCSLNDFNCTSQVGDLWYNLTQSETGHCTRPCEQEDYSSELLLTRYDPKNYRLSGCDLEDEPCLENFRDNTLKAEIYYAKLGYLSYNEKRITSTPNLISDMGSSISMLMGASYLSLIEIFIMIYECIRH